MHEPLLDRIRQLERSLRRWRLACFALGLIIVSLLATGGTFGLILVLAASDRDELWMEAAEARDRAEQARQAAEAARQEMLQKRKQAAVEVEP
jgi:hypothetical protein